MTDAIALIFAAFGGALTIIAALIVLNTIFARLLSDSVRMADTLGGRAFLFGLLNVVFLGAVALISVALAENGIRLFGLLAVLALGVLGGAVSFGLATLARLLGGRLLPDGGRLPQLALGSTLLTFACLTPFFGWFVMLPLLAIWGVGAVGLAVYHRRWPVIVVKQSIKESS